MSYRVFVMPYTQKYLPIINRGVTFGSRSAQVVGLVIDKI